MVGCGPDLPYAKKPIAKLSAHSTVQYKKKKVVEYVDEQDWPDLSCSKKPESALVQPELPLEHPKKVVKCDVSPKNPPPPPPRLVKSKISETCQLEHAKKVEKCDVSSRQIPPPPPPRLTFQKAPLLQPCIYRLTMAFDPD